MRRESSTYERVVFYHGDIGPMFFAFFIRVDKLIDIGQFKIALKKARV